MASVRMTGGQTINADATYTETYDQKNQTRRFVSVDQTMRIVARLHANDSYQLTIHRNDQNDVNMSCVANKLDEVVHEYMEHHSLQKIINLRMP